MVIGLDRFKVHFAGFEKQYALIGGVASEILMTEAGLAFRATKDFDIVLRVEVLDSAFVAKFMEFIESGGYQQRERSAGDKEFYRFVKPSEQGYPFMLELFSRKTNSIALPDNARFTPIAIDDEIASLSAILLDDAYYDLLTSGIKVVDGLPIVDAPVLIPLKASAFVNLTRSREAGEQIDAKNITKHRNDIFRLLQLLSPEHRVDLADSIKADLQTFIGIVDAEGTFSPKALGLGETSSEQQLQRLKDAYRL